MRSRSEPSVPSIRHEFAGAALGDERRKKRLVRLAEALTEDPAASFPASAGSDAALEATYRFLGNEAVRPELILAPHIEQSSARAAVHETVLVLHDTSNFEFPGEGTRSGLGPLRGKGQGFLGHVSMALVPGEARHPLGVLAFSTIVRGKIPKRRRDNWAARKADTDRESRRWLEGVENAEKRLSGGASAIHIMDREGDSYALLHSLLTAGRRFVIRLNHNRRTVDVGEKSIKLANAMADAQLFFEREVPIAKRKTPIGRRTRQVHPARNSRVAKLRFSARRIEFRRPTPLWTTHPPSLTLNVVHVVEVETQGSEKPIEWLLVTSEPIETAKDIEKIVDAYRSRWTIEEFFKALKTGCAFERRQLESKESLLNALAIFIPIAWRLLLLRTLAKDHTTVPAADALSVSQVEVLVATSKGSISTKPTARDAFMAIAALGGHIKNNGEPGWQVLGRGFEKLLILESGWLAARNAGRKK